jgi:phosphoribosyl-ATP pyrophosphohydrolase
VITLEELEAVLRQRRSAAPEGSYSATLVTDPERAGRKVMEEAYELCVEITRPAIDDRRVADEAADLLFHMLAALVAVDVGLDEVLAVLSARRGASHSNRQDG